VCVFVCVREREFGVLINGRDIYILYILLDSDMFIILFVVSFVSCCWFVLLLILVYSICFDLPFSFLLFVCLFFFFS